MQMTPNPSTDPAAAFAAGLQAATDGPDHVAQDAARERTNVKHWLGEISAARLFDEAARKQYAMDRRYARGDRGEFVVDVPIAQSNIDVLQSFLYAKNPDMECSPSAMTEPPPVKSIENMVRTKIKQAMLKQQQEQAKQEQMKQGLVTAIETHAPGSPIRNVLTKILPSVFGQAGSAAPPTAPGLPPAGAPPPGMQGMVLGQPPQGAAQGQPPAAPGQPPAPPQVDEKEVDAQVQAMMEPYQQKRDDASQLASTLEVVVSDAWKKAKLKATMKLVTASALTVGIGWFKASWLEREGKDPIVSAQIRDVREQLAQIAATKLKIDEPNGADADLSKSLLEQQMAGLAAKVDIIIARGMVIDFVPAEDMQVSTDVAQMAQYGDAGWLAQRSFKKFAQIQADYPNLTEPQIRKITKYSPVKPENTRNKSAGRAEDNIAATEADAYTKGGFGHTGADSSTSFESMPVGDIPAFGCIWELWNRNTGNVHTMIEGLDVYAKPVSPPQVESLRGHPFFAVLMGTIDGRRHPRSYIERSDSLLDEYNRTRSAFAKHRSRIIPKMAFDASLYDSEELKKLERATISEYVGLKSTLPGSPIAQAMHVIQYPAIDAALYDTAPIRADIETVWGIQDALGSAVHTAKTLGEAQIQQSGTNSRLSYQKDGIDAPLTEMAHYTAEITLQTLTAEDVQEIAGPWALWPQGMSIDDLHALVNIDIVAGSTGKPDVAEKRQVWSTLFPIVLSAVQQVGDLRGSTKEEIANSIESLIEETISRSGDRIDTSRFMPDPPAVPPPPPMPPPVALSDSALAGQQVDGLLAILAAVSTGALVHKSAKAVIMAGYPHIPDNLVDEMVNGALPAPIPTNPDPSASTTIEPKVGAGAPA